MRKSIFIFIFIFSNLCDAASFVDHNCSGLLYIDGEKNYNKIVCKAGKFFEVGLFENSVKKYHEAEKINFNELPNYRLNTRIAHGYLMMGNIKKAQYYINKSEIIILLLGGSYSCREDDLNGYVLVDESDKKIESQSAKEVVNLMCGGAYDYIYNPRSNTLDSMFFEGRLVEYYFKVKELIELRQKL